MKTPKIVSPEALEINGRITRFTGVSEHFPERSFLRIIGGTA